MAHPDLTGSQEGQMHKENATRCRVQVRHTNSQGLLNSRRERHPVARLCWEGGSSAEAGSAELLPNPVCLFLLLRGACSNGAFCSQPLLPCRHPGTPTCGCAGTTEPTEKTTVMGVES